MNVRRDLEELQRYYDLRATDYEPIYYRPDAGRRDELDRISDRILEWLSGRRVLEVACGTAYWTAIASDVARKIIATDGSEPMLAVARSKQLPASIVRFVRADAFSLEAVAGDVDAAMANFWLSHVPRRLIPGFLRGLHQRIGEGARVFMADNLRVPGSGGEFVRRAGHDDTFKRRDLADGTKHEILKNYYGAPELRRLLGPSARGLHIETGVYYWWLTYEVA